MHRNRAEQRATEERHLRRLLELAGLEATWVHGDRPDFVLEVDGRRVGLEHRELTEQDLASNEPNLRRLESALAAELRRRGIGEDLDIGLSLDAALPFFRAWRDVEAQLHGLADLIAARAPSVKPGAPVQLRGGALSAAHVEGIDFVQVARIRALAGPIVYVAPGFWGPAASSVVAAIREKEERLAAYAEANPDLDAFWLLLVTGDSWLQATDSALTAWTHRPTTFERVYLMDLRTGALQRIDARPR